MGILDQAGGTPAATAAHTRALVAPPPPFVAASRARVEWPTLALVGLCYVVWGVSTTWIAGLSPALAIVPTALSIALFSSLQHEALHGHPFRSRRLNAALVFPSLTLLIPYHRFRDTHLEHHNDPTLTDPYDDPESNFLDPGVWHRLPGWLRRLLAFNNTLLGRMTVGTAIGQAVFMAGDWRAIRSGDARVTRAWLWHIPALALVLAWLEWVAAMPLWAYASAAYAGLSLIKIRTFLEHRAHEIAKARTVIIEDRGPLAFLFLFNSLHAVHHSHPGTPWYRLWRLYRANREAFAEANGGYVYRSYAQVFRRHLLRAKDPVPHPLWR